MASTGASTNDNVFLCLELDALEGDDAEDSLERCGDDCDFTCTNNSETVQMLSETLPCPN
jgi:hypothetical protein